VLKDSSAQSRFYSSTCFNRDRGVLLTACINIKVWNAKVDPQVKFESIQRKAITKNALKEQVKRIQKEIDQLDAEEAKQVENTKRATEGVGKLLSTLQAVAQAGGILTKVSARKEQLKEELLASQTYITSGFQVQVGDMDADDSFAKTGNVLVTKQSKLVATLLVEGKNQLISIDCDFLMRVWSLENKK
jgi:hypothetical protein